MRPYDFVLNDECEKLWALDTIKSDTRSQRPIGELTLEIFQKESTAFENEDSHVDMISIDKQRFALSRE